MMEAMVKYLAEKAGISEVEAAEIVLKAVKISGGDVVKSIELVDLFIEILNKGRE
uniref:RC_I_2 n=1 Tax=synthetic construct TaxID=32630 RepID=UPI002493CFF8|nr:Chain 0, RC_I_2 [synthetic construct]8F53_2 Chain 2, RC_I_2 [synthetic construct]8F53_A Chain A, RC_I_2 [synthetic construct]8F53_Ae Chain Ae, RC_I_2 [synthetic construct]8F53_B Chain B, RC_I_2 [synthetic construct]8F53_Ba Chain Ba, RC_I_2 [synthetic construct]8F53_Bb Chain Bb, RC_I_2 [synthetic construct]8F53_C Chain C, RC_I_2 [synthetic construct]8F53_Ca Chain Ca, RC_I_2 [synthetic construct]8F53_Cz Chain Cz, RC_I_2 [synthetic construct]8F53_D Chain D, RC_I_2 [synthetic construct]8F